MKLREEQEHLEFYKGKTEAYQIVGRRERHGNWYKNDS